MLDVYEKQDIKNVPMIEHGSADISASYIQLHQI